MPANRRVLTLTGAVAAVQTAAVLTATRAFADPTSPSSPTAPASPSPTPTPTPTKSSNACELIHGAARDICERDNGSSGGGSTGTTPTNPLT
ncbi:hypothetical protein L0F81_43090, partial [Streptomyces tricolor]|nr:hypothetical protein [Streptomyces tricolor]